jgi:hypothetical protein
MCREGLREVASFAQRSDLDDAVDDQKSVDEAAQGQQEDENGDARENFVAHGYFPLIKWQPEPVTQLTAGGRITVVEICARVF